MSADNQRLRQAKEALRAGDSARATILLRGAVHPDDLFVMQTRAARLLAAIPEDAQPGQLSLKIALVASSTIDHFADVLRYWLFNVGIVAEIYVAPFDMIVQTVLDETSELYAFRPDIVWLFTSHRDVRASVSAGASRETVNAAVSEAVNFWVELWQVLLERLSCIVMQNNADIPAEDAFGNMSGTAPWGGRSVLRQYNHELGAAAPAGVVIFDLDHVAALYGKRQWFETRYWFHSKHAFNLDASGLIASQAARLIAAAKGQAKKCLVLDLDNTLWGGVIGDDGLDGIKLGMKADGEAFVAFQAFARALKERGIVLAVCSKNEDANAREVFERHPDMQLRLDDIAVFRANWNNKVDNLRDIAATLNLGLDSLVFVDDNPAEREIVRQFLPMVEVPELPEDPAFYVAALAGGAYFEAVSFSDEDRERARMYQENARRSELQMSFKDTASYLTSLAMIGGVGELDSFHLARMAQLINKSNQFHLTTTRYPEAELQAMARRPDHVVRYFKLRDRFGDNGLISVVILRQEQDTLVVDTWVMSCRVLARSMEEFILDEIIGIARARNCGAILGTYRPTAKNKLVSGLYERLGFEKAGDDGGVTSWRLAVVPGCERTTYVRTMEMAE